MKKLIIYCTLALTTMLISCSDAHNNNYFKGDIVEEKSFPKEITANAQHLNHFDSLLTGVSSFKLYDDIILTGRGRQQPQLLSFINKEGNSEVIFMRGNGPNEHTILSLSNNSTVDESGNTWIYMFEKNKNEYFKLNLTKRVNDGVLEIVQLKVPEDTQEYFLPEIIDANRTVFQLYDNTDEIHYLVIFDHNKGEVLKRIALSEHKFLWPFHYTPFSYNLNTESMKYSIAPTFMDQIMLIDLENEQSKIFSQNKKLVDWNILTQAEDYPSKQYGGSTKLGKYFACSKYDQNSDIEIYDWNCKPILKIKTDLSIYSIAYVKNLNALYIYTQDETLYTLSLENLID